MGSKASAFCPGHITAFFEICEDENILRKGSRGAGICLSKGAVSHVEVEEAETLEISVTVDGRSERNSVTELALRKMLPDRKLRVIVVSENHLPVSQGFGMSGAGALSAVLALASILDSPMAEEELVQTAHAAEVESMTGLGDVYPQFHGGLVVREQPGAPPYGRIRSLKVEESLVLCVLGGAVRTKTILQEKELVKRIVDVGRRCVDSFLSHPTLDRLLSLGKEFAVETGLASERILKAIEDCEEFGHAGMSMLGNSIFAIGEIDRLKATLERYGKVLECEVENRGARLLQPLEEHP